MYFARHFDLGWCIFVFIASFQNEESWCNNTLSAWSCALPGASFPGHLVIHRRCLPDQNYCTYRITTYNVLSPCFCSLQLLLFRCDTSLQYANFLHNPVHTANHSALIGSFSSYIANLMVLTKLSWSLLNKDCITVVLFPSFAVIPLWWSLQCTIFLLNPQHSTNHNAA